MNQRPIGVFDSGLGGLTMVKALTALLPGEDIIYLGDTGRVPYGPRSRETILRYAMQDAAFLTGFDIKAMVVACNTVCSIAYDILKDKYGIPVYEVVKTPAGVAAGKTKNGNIGVIGTAATIRSGAYERAIKEISQDINVYSAPCPLFVPLAEEGRTGYNDKAAQCIAQDYLGPLCGKNIDTLILGCTHYSLLMDVIKATAGNDVLIIDSGAETARFVAGDLSERELLRDSKGEGTIAYYVTDSIESFSQQASNFLKSDINGSVTQISLEQY